MPKIENPFDGQAARLMRDNDLSQQNARDAVVIEHLIEGDTRALAHWFMGDYNPGKAVKAYLSFMLQPERSAAEDPKITYTSDPEIIPYQLVAKKRGGGAGRRLDPVVAERNQAIKDQYDRRVSEVGPGGSDSVIAQMAEEFGPGISKSMIREALKERSPKSS